MVSMVVMSFALCGLCIFACVRSMAWDIDAALYIKRVPTKDNIADDPSRERYDLLERMEVRPPFFTFPSSQAAIDGKTFVVQAVKVEAVIDERFDNAQAWSSLNATAHRQWWAEMKVPDEKPAIALD